MIDGRDIGSRLSHNPIVFFSGSLIVRRALYIFILFSSHPPILIFPTEAAHIHKILLDSCSQTYEFLCIDVHAASFVTGNMSAKRVFVPI